jgi:hypothetical protein
MGGMAGQFTAALPAAGHRLVALGVMETFVRYSRVLQQSQALLPSVVMTFLDARGLGHASEVGTDQCVHDTLDSLRVFTGMCLVIGVKCVIGVMWSGGRRDRRNVVRDRRNVVG